MTVRMARDQTGRRQGKDKYTRYVSTYMRISTCKEKSHKKEKKKKETKNQKPKPTQNKRKKKKNDKRVCDNKSRVFLRDTLG